MDTIAAKACIPHGADAAMMMLFVDFCGHITKSNYALYS